MITLAEYFEAKFGAAPSFEVACPGCGTILPAFAITKHPPRWRCGHCHLDAARSVAPAFEIGWNDVRGVRTELLARSDWTQLADVAEDVRASWCAVRTELRDITVNHETPIDAMAALDAIRVARFA